MISAQVWADAQRVWDFQQMGHEPRPCSVAIGLVPLIVFTGATSRTTRDRMPRGEAEHYRERAVELGVPAGAVLVEPRARNTGENIRFSRALLEERGVPVSSVLLVSKPYEERRAHATACKLWPEAQWVSASAPTTLAGYVDSIGDAGLVLDMLAGAQQRLMVYPQRGFMIEQHVPDDVAAAYERLRGAGFAGRLVPGEASS